MKFRRTFIEENEKGGARGRVSTAARGGAGSGGVGWMGTKCFTSMLNADAQYTQNSTLSSW